MIKNPIYQRELRGAVRDPKIILLVITFLAVLSAVLYFLWPDTGVFSEASGSSKQIFSIFLLSNLALIILLVPALASPSITMERENNSFDLLFTSLLSPGEVLRGKLFSAITMILLVVLISMCVTSVCALCGGFGPTQLLRAYVVIGMAALTYGMVSLAFSAICRSTFSALMLSYVTVAVLAGSTWLPYALLSSLFQMRGFWLTIRSLSPFDALYSQLYPGRYEGTLVSRMSDNPNMTFYIHLFGMAVVFLIALAIFIRYVLTAPKPGTIFRWLTGALVVLLIVLLGVEFSLYKTIEASPPDDMAMQATGGMSPLFTVIAGSAAVDALLVVLIWILFNVSRAKSLHADQFTDMRTAVKRKLTWPFYLIDPLKRKAPIGRLRNPVFVAEMRSKVFARPRFIIWTLFGCIVMSMVMLVIMAWQFAGVRLSNQDLVRSAAVVFQIAIVALLAPAISSGAITDEITSRTFGMLRMTPLSALTVVLGKMKAGFLFVSIFLISSLPVLFSLAYLDLTKEEFNWTSFWRVGVWLAILIATTLAFITAGFCASAYAKTTSSATAISYTFAAVVCIVSFAGVIPGAFEPDVQNIILTVNPAVAALRVTSDSMFAQLSPQIWLHNLAFLLGISLFFILASAVRTWYIFTRRT